MRTWAALEITQGSNLPDLGKESRAAEYIEVPRRALLYRETQQRETQGEHRGARGAARPVGEIEVSGGVG